MEFNNKDIRWFSDILPAARQAISGRTQRGVWDYGMAIERPRWPKGRLRRLFYRWIR